MHHCGETCTAGRAGEARRRGPRSADSHAVRRSMDISFLGSAARQPGRERGRTLIGQRCIFYWFCLLVFLIHKSLPSARLICPIPPASPRHPCDPRVPSSNLTTLHSEVAPAGKSIRTVPCRAAGKPSVYWRLLSPLNIQHTTLLYFHPFLSLRSPLLEWNELSLFLLGKQMGEGGTPRSSAFLGVC